jgi:hypothetical protein
MQADDRAEYELTKVREVFSAVLKDSERAARLLEHVRYRTGLLLERRPSVFAFAHLTFQEYLAARAIHEGNQLGISIEQLIEEQGDPRWQEVIPLYCGLVPAPAARRVVEALMGITDTPGFILAESYLSAGPELAQDLDLRRRVIWAIANKRMDLPGETSLRRFPAEEVSPIANEVVGRTHHNSFDYAFVWLRDNRSSIDFDQLVQRLTNRTATNTFGIGELNFLIHSFAKDDILVEVARDSDLYSLPGTPGYETEAEISFEALIFRGPDIGSTNPSPGADAAFLQALRAVLASNRVGPNFAAFAGLGAHPAGLSRASLADAAPLIERLAERLRSETGWDANRIERFTDWFGGLNREYKRQPDAVQSQPPPPRPAKKATRKQR